MGAPGEHLGAPGSPRGAPYLGAPMGPQCGPGVAPVPCESDLLERGPCAAKAANLAFLASRDWTRLPQTSKGRPPTGSLQGPGPKGPGPKAQIEPQKGPRVQKHIFPDLAV